MESTDPGSNWLENNDIQKVRHPEKLVFELRDFRYPADYPEVRSLWQGAGPGIQTGRSDELEEICKKVERDPDLFIIAENQGKVIGAVLGGFDGRRGIVYHLAVDPNYRQQGIASALMEELERRLRARGCIRSYLLTTRDNHQAIDFYEKRGWVRLDLYAYGKDLE